jgi:carboxypeptidase Taq
MTLTAYSQLTALHASLHRLDHLGAIAGWDQAANMPPKGNEARAAALAELATLTHRMRTEPGLKRIMDEAEQEDLSETQRANLREIRRDWRAANALPESLVERRQLATSRCEHAWRSQRPANDWNGFLENFREVVAVGREEASRLADELGCGRYEALMDRYEPGMTTAEVDRIFGDLRGWLPALIEQVIDRQSQEPVINPEGPFDVERQRELCGSVMRLLEFDFEAGRLDVSAHPFCGGVPEDVRLTTRFSTRDFLGSLMGTVHETGHGRYEQNRPRDLIEQPVSQSRSMAIHESQSLSFEMQLGSHPGFVGLMAPLVRAHLGDQPAFESANLAKLLTRVKRGLIRVEADEVTYPAHILLRYEIERALVEGDIEADDIPTLWNEQMKALLHLDSRGNFRDGPLQDVHWPEGLFGYFPCYTLGAMYAAQWFATMRRELPDLDGCITRGELSPVFNWLRERIWIQGSRWTTEDLCRRASGEALTTEHFRRHLQARYLSVRP